MSHRQRRISLLTRYAKLRQRGAIVNKAAVREMDVGLFIFTQPNSPITYLREMQTPVL